MDKHQEERQRTLVIFALIGIWFLGLVLWMGISTGGFDLLWWLTLLSVAVLITALIVVYRRMFR